MQNSIDISQNTIGLQDKTLSNYYDYFSKHYRITGQNSISNLRYNFSKHYRIIRQTSIDPFYVTISQIQFRITAKLYGSNIQQYSIDKTLSI